MLTTDDILPYFGSSRQRKEYPRRGCELRTTRIERDYARQDSNLRPPV